MKKELFEKAQTLSVKIEDCENAIVRIKEDKPSCSGNPINVHFSYDEDYTALKNNAISFLAARKKKLQKEFDNLK